MAFLRLKAAAPRRRRAALACVESGAPAQRCCVRRCAFLLCLAMPSPSLRFPPLPCDAQPFLALPFSALRCLSLPCTTLPWPTLPTLPCPSLPRGALQRSHLVFRTVPLDCAPTCTVEEPSCRSADRILSTRALFCAAAAAVHLLTRTGANAGSEMPMGPSEKTRRWRFLSPPSIWPGTSGGPDGNSAAASMTPFCATIAAVHRLMQRFRGGGAGGAGGGSSACTAWGAGAGAAAAVDAAAAGALGPMTAGVVSPS